MQSAAYFLRQGIDANHTKIINKIIFPIIKNKNSMKLPFLFTVGSLIMFSLISCNQSGGDQNNVQKDSTNNQTVVATYIANLQGLNSNVTKMTTTAQAKFILTADSLFVTIDAKGVAPGIQHWQHFHGFADGKSASCAEQSNDKNNDGIIDVVETETTSGTTMVPFNDKSAEMDLGSDTYPKAGNDSTYHYEVSIPLSQLKASFAKAFGDSTLNLDKRVLYIHGVPSDTKLPSTVASLGKIPVQVTLPIACGIIEKIE